VDRSSPPLYFFARDEAVGECAFFSFFYVFFDRIVRAPEGGALRLLPPLLATEKEGGIVLSFLSRTLPLDRSEAALPPTSLSSTKSEIGSFSLRLSFEAFFWGKTTPPFLPFLLEGLPFFPKLLVAGRGCGSPSLLMTNSCRGGLQPSLFFSCVLILQFGVDGSKKRVGAFLGQVERRRFF